jgi:hypothetical protein
LPRRSHGLAVALVFLAGVAFAGTPPAGEPLDELIQRSGLDAQLTHFEAAMQRGITEAHATQRKLASEDVSRLRKAVAGAYSASSLRPVLRAELAKTLSAAEIAAALAWLDSPTGRKLTALEEKAPGPGAATARVGGQARSPRLGAARTKTLHGLIRPRGPAGRGQRPDETAIGINEGWPCLAEGLACARGPAEPDGGGRATLVAGTSRPSPPSPRLRRRHRCGARGPIAFARSPAGARYHDGTAAFAARRAGGQTTGRARSRRP